MNTTIVLRGLNPLDFKVNTTLITHGKVNKSEVMKPGKMARITTTGAEIRVFKRGNPKNPDGSPYAKETSVPCWWHKVGFDTPCMGIPIRRRKGIVWMDGMFCSYGCVYAFLLDHFEKRPDKIDPNYKDSIVLLLEMFSEDYPKEILTPSHDWRLLKHVGNGTMSVKELLVTLKSLKVKRNPVLSFCPIEQEYQILK